MHKIVNLLIESCTWCMVILPTYLHACMRAAIRTAEIDASVIHGGRNDGNTNKHMNTRTYDGLINIFLRSRCALEGLAAGARQVEAVTSSIGGVQQGPSEGLQHIHQGGCG